MLYKCYVFAGNLSRISRDIRTVTEHYLITPPPPNPRSGGGGEWRVSTINDFHLSSLWKYQINADNIGLRGSCSGGAGGGGRRFVYCLPHLRTGRTSWIQMTGQCRADMSLSLRWYMWHFAVIHRSSTRYFNPLSPHDAFTHHITSLKTDLVFLQARVLERIFPWNWLTNTW